MCSRTRRVKRSRIMQSCIGTLTVLAFSAAAAAGVTYEYYEGEWSSLPDFGSLTPVATGEVDSFSIAPRARDDYFAFKYDGYISLPGGGDYTFYTASDDGSKLYINGSEIVDNDGRHGVVQDSGMVTLSAGYHEITVTFFENDGGQALTASYAGPGISKRIIPSSVLFTESPDPSPPQFTTHPSNRTVLAGQTATFEVGVTGNPIPSLQWYRDGSALSGATATSYTTPVVSAGDDGAEFYCTATNSEGSATSNTAVLTVQASGGILRHAWFDITGSAIPDLTGDPDFPDNPDLEEVRDIFEAPSWVGDHYGTRMFGYVHPPQSGSYVFWIAGDDHCELWLSSDSDPANKVLIAEVPGWANPQEWTKYAEQQSAPISLTAGNRYYIEALQKEHQGGDNLAVGWQLPDAAMERPIPGARLSPYDPGGPTTYTLTVVDDGNGTTVPSGATVVESGPATTVTATAAGGYFFDAWTVTAGTADIADPASASTTVQLNSGDATIQANFTAETYNLTVASAGNGTTTPSGTVDAPHGTAIGIEAFPAVGYDFQQWQVTSGTAAIDNPAAAATSVVLTSGDAAVEAQFALMTYTLTVSDDGNGATTPAGAVTVNHGQSVSVEATADNGYTFENWTVQSGSAAIDDANASATSVVLTDGNAEIRANFAPVAYELTVEADAGGTTNPSGAVTVSHGVPRAIEAAPDAGYEFTIWRVETGSADIADPAASSTSVTLNAGDAVIAAGFATRTYTMTMAVNGNGSTTPSGSATVEHGVPQTITATPDAGAVFAGWEVIDGSATIDDPSSATTTATLVSGNATIQANFDLLSYTLYVLSGDNGTTDPTGAVSVDHGVPAVIRAIPDAGYAFGSWSVDSGSAEIDDPLQAQTGVTLLEGNAKVAATFVEDPDYVPSSRMLTISGQLVDANGNPVGVVEPESVDVTVRLTTAAQEGDTVYTEEFLKANEEAPLVDNGFFAVRLGSGTSGDDLEGCLTSFGDLYVEFTIEEGGPDVLLPRIPLTASPYSFSGTAAANTGATVLRGEGNPNDLGVTAAIGTYYVDQSAGATWLKLESGWKWID